MNITSTQTLVINKSLETVFAFFANPANDRLWRREISQTTLDGLLQAGVTAFEYAYLSKKSPRHLTELHCTAFEKNRLAIFQTPATARFFLKSQRQVNMVAEDKTAITYSLEFDPAVVKEALGVALPRWVIALKTNSDRKKYLGQLKKILERS